MCAHQMFTAGLLSLYFIQTTGRRATIAAFGFKVDSKNKHVDQGLHIYIYIHIYICIYIYGYVGVQGTGHGRIEQEQGGHRRLGSGTNSAQRRVRPSSSSSTEEQKFRKPDAGLKGLYPKP